MRRSELSVICWLATRLVLGGLPGLSCGASDDPRREGARRLIRGHRHVVAATRERRTGPVTEAIVVIDAEFV
jgi:hypothetical protein